MRHRRIHLIVSISTLTAGVNLPFIGHVALHSATSELATLAQMIGRAGRGDFEFAFLAHRTPPTPAQILESWAPPAPGSIIYLCL
jgi:superfamily II DNA or RNA helicase